MIKMQNLIYYTLGRSKLCSDNKAVTRCCHLFGLTCNGSLLGEAVLKIGAVGDTYEQLTLKHQYYSYFAGQIYLLFTNGNDTFLTNTKTEILFNSGKFLNQVSETKGEFSH